MTEIDFMKNRMDRIRLLHILGHPLTEQQLMCIQIEENGFGCAGSEAPQVVLSTAPHPAAGPSTRIYHLDGCRTEGHDGADLVGDVVDPDNGYWGAIVVLPGAGGQHMRNDFEDQDEALDWVLSMQAMYRELGLRPSSEMPS